MAGDRDEAQPLDARLEQRGVSLGKTHAVVRHRMATLERAIKAFGLEGAQDDSNAARFELMERAK